MSVATVSPVYQSGLAWPCLYCWHRKWHICDKQINVFTLATFSWMSSHPPSPFRRCLSARKLLRALLFEWLNRKHVSLPVIIWNGKSKHHFHTSLHWNTSAVLQPSLTESGIFFFKNIINPAAMSARILDTSYKHISKPLKVFAWDGQSKDTTKPCPSMIKDVFWGTWTSIKHSTNAVNAPMPICFTHGHWDREQIDIIAEPNRPFPFVSH